MSIVTTHRGFRGLGDGPAMRLAPTMNVAIAPPVGITPQSGGSSSDTAGSAATLSPNLFRLAMDHPLAHGIFLQPPGGGAGASEACACMVGKVAAGVAQQTGVALPAAAVAQLNALCASNVDALKQAAKQAGINLDPCKPWYMRKTTWIAGGVLALVGVGAFVALR